MIRLRARHPLGFDLMVDVPSLEAADALIKQLLDKGYTPMSAASESSSWPTGPDGKSPLCKKHGMVMQLRSKQSDEWHSHKVIAATGEELYCRGYRHGPADKDGFLVDL